MTAFVYLLAILDTARDLAVPTLSFGAMITLGLFAFAVGGGVAEETKRQLRRPLPPLIVLLVLCWLILLLTPERNAIKNALDLVKAFR